ncbi:MAG: hypothetical protein IJV31_03430 [Clostridia bacterium]|nr:hypothetical protein [Clostridia bacterium]
MKKKKIIFYFTFLIFALLLIFLLSNIYYRVLANNNMNNLISLVNGENDIFSIQKIVFFSNCNAKSKINENSSITISDLYQYTDIAIFIENNENDQEYTPKNTLKNVSIKNITFTVAPSVGKYNLYYQNLNNFASGVFSQENLLQESVEFAVTSSDEVDYSTPVLYNNCANPITLAYVNQNIIEEYTLPESENSIEYSGSLLKQCNIPLSSLNCKINFDIFITNNLDETFKCNLFFDIPLKDDDKSIYDGSYQKQLNTNFRFLKQI